MITKIVMLRDVQDVAVLGAGLMGTCIAGELAFHGHRVKVYDCSGEALERATRVLAEHKEQLRREGLMVTQDFLGTVSFVGDLESAIRNARFIFEAVFEDLSLKQDLFVRIPCNGETVISSNTIALDVSQIAERAQQPESDSYWKAWVKHCSFALVPHHLFLAMHKWRNEKEFCRYKERDKTQLAVHDILLYIQRERLRASVSHGNNASVVFARIGPGLNCHGGLNNQHAITQNTVQPLEQSQEERYTDGEKNECVVCMDGARAGLLVPCHHLCVCMECADTLKQNQSLCPVCRQTFTTVIRVYQP